MASLAGVGLFVLTAAVSQWIQSTKRCEADCDELQRQSYSTSHSCEYEDDFRLLYRNRRLADRLSYENLPQILSLQSAATQEDAHPVQGHFDDMQSQPPVMQGPSHFENENVNRAPGKILTEWNLLQQHRRSNAILFQQQQLHDSRGNMHQDDQGWTPLTRKFSEREAHPNAHHDFHPKNRNWRHFEHYNEHDRQRREEKLMREQAKTVNDGINTDTKAEPVCTPQVPQMMSLNDTGALHTDSRKTLFRTRRSASSDISGATLNSDNATTDDEDDYDDVQSISASSDSEEEEFVWTKHRRNSTSARLSELPHQLKAKSKKVDVSLNGTPAVEQQREVQKPKDPPPNNNVSSLPSRPVQMVRRFLSLDEAQDKKAATNDTNSQSIGRANPPLRSASLEMYNRRIRAEYNARIMPEKLVLIRHGQSMGNINEVLYSTTPDNAMPLTRLGWEQARNAGAILKDKILTPGESVHFIVSPYVRTVETFHGIVSAWCDPSSPEFTSITNHDEKVKAWYGRLMQLGLTWNEDSRLREQDFGNYQNPEVIKRAKEERHRFGAFYYRFPHGESASDVFDRVSTFLDSLWRSFEMNKSRNYVLVTHGIVLRVLLARYFRYTIDQFNTLANPRNCEMVVLGHSGDGKLDLEGRCDLDVERETATDELHVTGHKFHKRLRILPKSAIRKVKIRISPDD
jgi:broad specificity phosphatase PhoE